MARRAILVDDGRDLLVEQHGGVRSALRGERQRGEQSQNEANDSAVAEVAETSLADCCVHWIRHPMAFVSDCLTVFPEAMASRASRKLRSVTARRFFPRAT